MVITKLTDAELELVQRVERGEAARFTSSTTISAEVIRHMILGLPLVQEDGAAAKPCANTGRGISVEGATVEGRLLLDSAFGPAGSPICPLEFSRCVFNGGISASNAHFSRLSLRECSFIHHHLLDGAGRACPTIDISDAEFGRTLDMQAIAPASGSRVLSVRGTGLRLRGSLDLSDCTLCAPSGSEAGEVGVAAGADPNVEPEEDFALDLSLSRIAGDVSLLDGTRVDGGFKLRSAQIEGDLRLRAAKFAAWSSQYAILMQGARIGGYLVMDWSLHANPETPAIAFECDGPIRANSVEIGLALHLKGKVKGDIIAHDLRVREDVVLRGTVEGSINLQDAQIGGSLELGGLQIFPSEDTMALDLENATIGRSLNLNPRPSLPEISGFLAIGCVDLSAVTCGTLNDGVGTLWGDQASLRMNQFVYRRTGWAHEHEKIRKPTHRIVGDWIKARIAETRWLWRPRSEFPEDFWEPWQLRRNWIYRHFGEPQGDLIDHLRRRIREEEFRPQPLEQAVRVARAEGREDFATQFEILKRRIEWQHFNRRLRWGLAFIGITLATLWLLNSRQERPAENIGAAYVLTAGLMCFGTVIRDWLRIHVIRPLLRDSNPVWIPDAILVAAFLALLGASGIAVGPILMIATVALVVVLALIGSWIGVRPGSVGERRTHREKLASKLLAWGMYWLPATALFLVDWRARPFHFLVAFLIFMVIRMTGVLAHQMMRFGFGYMRRPILAIATLIIAFLVGWGGVGLANFYHMFVVSTEPVAAQIADVDLGHDDELESAPTWMAVSARGGPWARDISCRHELSEPLYALDVLIPLVDLHEEDRCEIRRVRKGHAAHHPSDLKFGQILEKLPELTTGNPRFWWWMKALYAIAGWVLVSLALLTFAQVNRTHGEPAEAAEG